MDDDHDREIVIRIMILRMVIKMMIERCRRDLLPFYSRLLFFVATAPLSMRSLDHNRLLFSNHKKWELFLFSWPSRSSASADRVIGKFVSNEL